MRKLLLINVLACAVSVNNFGGFAQAQSATLSLCGSIFGDRFVDKTASEQISTFVSTARSRLCNKEYDSEEAVSTEAEKKGLAIDYQKELTKFVGSYSEAKNAGSKSFKEKFRLFCDAEERDLFSFARASSSSEKINEVVIKAKLDYVRELVKAKDVFVYGIMNEAPALFSLHISDLRGGGQLKIVSVTPRDKVSCKYGDEKNPIRLPWTPPRFK